MFHFAYVTLIQPCFITQFTYSAMRCGQYKLDLVLLVGSTYIQKVFSDTMGFLKYNTVLENCHIAHLFSLTGVTGIS